MGDFGEPGGVLEKLERLAYGVEEVKLTTSEERHEGELMRVGIVTISSVDETNEGSVNCLKDHICRYACKNGYKDFYQGERTVKFTGGVFLAEQRILYLQYSLSDGVVKDLRVHGKDLDKILAEIQSKGLVKEIVRE